METRNRASVVVGSAALIATAAGVAWLLLSREPGATHEARTAEPDAPLAQKGDYLVPRRKPDTPLAQKGDYLIPRRRPSPDVAARWMPSGPEVTLDAGLPNEDIPSTKGPLAPPTPPSSPTSGQARAEATGHSQAGVRHDRDVCAARGMRREDLYQDNRWRSWRCVR
jgi:hypothetical protein